MVTASNIDETKLAVKYSKEIEIIDRIIPNHNAWFFCTLPVGIGLKHVLVIKASRSDSYHMFRAPAAPAPRATANNEIIETVNETFSGAINKPTILVNKTRDITLGFIKLKNELKLELALALKFLDLTAE
jgi:hypothetical protein